MTEDDDALQVGRLKYEHYELSSVSEIVRLINPHNIHPFAASG